MWRIWHNRVFCGVVFLLLMGLSEAHVYDEGLRGLQVNQGVIDYGGDPKEMEVEPDPE